MCLPVGSDHPVGSELQEVPLGATLLRLHSRRNADADDGPAVARRRGGGAEGDAGGGRHGWLRVYVHVARNRSLQLQALAELYVCCERVCAASPASIYTRPRARRRRLNLTSGAPTHARTQEGVKWECRRCRCCRCVRLRCMYEAGYALLPPFGSTPTNHARTHARPGVNAPSNQVTVG